jgi:peptidoglycan-associated lipoprotein
MEDPNMMRFAYRAFTGLALALGTAGLVACAGSKPVVKAPVVAEPAKPTPSAGTTAPEPVASKSLPGAPAWNPIYFDFDSYTVPESSRPELEKVADGLRQAPGQGVVIAGHTDERGTTEYNLALGDQRAKSAHDYIVRLGVDPLRVKTISYGEERPAVQGSSEESWSKNRRDEFSPR